VQLVGFMQMAPMAFGPVLGRMADSGDKILMEKVAVGAVLFCSCCITLKGPMRQFIGKS
jgi:hypothetical protein